MHPCIYWLTEVTFHGMQNLFKERQFIAINFIDTSSSINGNDKNFKDQQSRTNESKEL